MKSPFVTLTSAAPCKLAPWTEPLCLAGAVLWDSCYRPPLDSSKAARALHRAALKTNCQTDSGSVRHLSNVRARAAFQSSVHALEPNGRRAVVMGAWKIAPGPRGCSCLHKPHHSIHQRLNYLRIDRYRIECSATLIPGDENYICYGTIVYSTVFEREYATSWKHRVVRVGKELKTDALSGGYSSEWEERR
jgi:hypothetical protein